MTGCIALVLGFACMASLKAQDVPRIRRGNVRVGPAYTRAHVTRVMQRHRDEFLACYEAALRSAPEPEGRIVLGWSIDEEGRVRDARVRASTLDDLQLERCVLGVLRRSRFPAPHGGSVQIVYPLYFADPPAEALNAANRKQGVRNRFERVRRRAGANP